jgi:hypothetical protein
VTYSERAIVRLLQVAAVDHPFAVELIAAIERGDHLHQPSPTGRVTVQIPADALEARDLRSAA